MRQTIEICAGMGIVLVLWKTTKEFKMPPLSKCYSYKRNSTTEMSFFLGIGNTICRRRLLYLVKTKMMTKWYSKNTRSIPGEPDIRTPPLPLSRRKVLATLCYVNSIYITQRKR